MSESKQSRLAPSSEQERRVLFRSPTIADGPVLASLVRESGVLDPNSDYAYLLIGAHFSTTSVIAECSGETAGFVTAYIPPEDPQTLFVWQVYVCSQYRRMGLAAAMIESLLRRITCRNVRYVAATVNPSNRASEKLFRSLAAKYRTECRTSVLFPEHLFRSGDHEEETLFKVGPLR